MSAFLRLERQLCAAVRDALAGGKARPPIAGLLLWNTFQRLSAGRTYHAAGPNPIALAEIEALCRLIRLPLEPRHVAILVAMDRAWIETALASRAQPGAKTLPRITGEANPAVLDAAMGWG
jgi:hypothetical protein